MATTGKKGRKVKGKTLGLSEFLADNNETPQAGYAVATANKTVDWAAEMENEQLDDKYTLEAAGPKDKFILPTGPRATREPSIDASSIPSKPPYTAFIANLPYDIDQEDILNFFKKLKVKSVRVPRDGGESGRVKGFGYADFDDRESFLEALSMNDETLKGRKIRIHVAESQENERENNRNDRRDDGADRTIGDWRSAPREDSYSQREDKYRNGSDRFADRNDRYFQERDRDRYTHDRGYGRGYESSNYGGYGSDRERGNSMDRGYSSGERDRLGGDRYRDRDRERFDKFNRGFDRSGRSGRRDFGSDFRNERERYDRYDDGGRGGRNEGSSFDRFDRGGSYERDIDKETPKARKKLVLAPRSVPIASSNSVSSSAIFGGAKPVDTAAIDRKIEERLEKEKKGFKDGDGEKKERDKVDKYEESNENEEYSDSVDDSKNNRDEPESYPLRRRSTESRSQSSHSLNSGTQESSHYNECASQSEPEDDKSERSRFMGKPPSPRKEDSKFSTATLPKDNVWQKRTGQEGEKENKQFYTIPRTKRSSSISSNSSDKDRSRRSSFDRPPSGRRQDGDSHLQREGSRGRQRDDYQYRDDSTSRRRSEYERSSERQGGRGGNKSGSNRKERVWVRRDPNPRENSHERIQDKGRQKERFPKDLPKYEEQKVTTYTTRNKYSLLNEDEDHRGSGSD